MTIHHDKMAYGKLDPLREEFSLERLNDMADALNGEGEGRSEREKMLAGELYDPSDPELSALRARARRLARAYNDAGEDEPERFAREYARPLIFLVVVFLFSRITQNRYSLLRAKKPLFVIVFIIPFFRVHFN